MQHESTMRRSQVILRMPVDYRDATLILEDGERLDVILFVPHSESVERHLEGPERFVPVMHAARVVLIARAAITCATVVEPPLPAATEAAPDLPYEHQRAVVKLRGGVTLQGELRWPAVEGRQRTADHLNAPEPHLVLHEAERTHYLAKSHVISVEELEG